MIFRNASMTDLLSISAVRDSCVLLPTLDHAVQWWSAIIEMIDHREPNILRTRTSVVRRRSGHALRLWVPNRDREMPMEYEHEFVYHCDYILLYDLSLRRDIKWLN